MTSRTRLTMLATAAWILIGTVPVVMAQSSQTGREGSRTYDPKTEITIKGTVERIETVSEPGGRGRRSLGGTHLSVKTDKETFEVHVGPTAYLEEKGLTLAKGDSVEVLGSRMTIHEEPVLIARQITRGDDTWTLRDASGRPVWSGRGRSQRDERLK